MTHHIGKITIVLAAALVLGGCAGTGPPATGSAPPAASATVEEVAGQEEAEQTWVGPVPGTQANIAIQTFADGRAQAYVCDGGGLVSVLFEGQEAADGSLRLEGPDGAIVEATPDAQDGFEGTVVVVDRPFAFVTEPAQPPGGYYKADGNNLGLRWVVLNDGTQSGSALIDGALGPAPSKPGDGSIVFNGQTLETQRVTTLWRAP